MCVRYIYLKLICILLLLCCIRPEARGEETITQVTHYSVDNGLSENHILCMLQDRKGIMWFGTYNGLNKFDGYSFRCFKGRAGQTYKLSNFRVDRMKEDKQGFLWLQTNDLRIYRFDPEQETFLPVPQCDKSFADYRKPLSKIQVMDDGSVWLSNGEAGKDDCFRICNTPDRSGISLQHIDLKSLGNADKINRIYHDRSGNDWILTSQSVELLPKNKPQPVDVFKGNPGGFYSVCETDKALYFGAAQGQLWIYNKATHKFSFLQVPVANKLIDLLFISTAELLVLTNESQFFIYNTLSGIFTPNQLSADMKQTLYGTYKDRQHNVWIDSENPGGILFDTRLRQLIYLPVDTTGYVNPRTLKFSVAEDAFNNLWMLPHRGGFYKYNALKRQLEPIAERGDDEKSITNLAHSAIADRQGNLWMSTYLEGVDKIVFRHSPFTFVRPVESKAYTARNEIRSVYQDRRNRLWVGSKKGAVYMYDASGKCMGYLGQDGKLNSAKAFNAPVYEFKEDHRGRMWLATKGNGLYLLESTGQTSFAIRNFQYDAADVYSINSNSVYSVFEDSRQRLWVGTFWAGLNLIDETGGDVRFISARNRLTRYPTDECFKVRCFAEDKNGRMLVGTTQGLLSFSGKWQRPEDIRFTLFKHDPEKAHSLSGNDVYAILPARNGDVYITTIGGGVDVLKGGFSENTPVFQSLKGTDGLPINAVYTLTEDRKGNLWMSTQTQVMRYHPRNATQEIYKPVASGNYFFDEAAVCKTRQGQIIYGTSNGLLSFHPDRISKSNFVPRICLTRLLLFNREVEVGGDQSPLSKVIDETPELTLNSDQNTFSIEYAALDYANPQGIQYAYKLEGFEKEWNYVGTQRIATYINLPKGTYKFHVRSTNSDGQWVSNERIFTIVKRPSFWESAWGFLFYTVMLLLLSAVVAWVLFIIYRLRNEVAVEQRITNMKLRFFTDISHELRTPLTLIASPVESILTKDDTPAPIREQLQVVKRNTDRMLRLINQILDFRKIQNEKMKLVLEHVDVAAYVSDICVNFRELADENNIRLMLTNRATDASLWIDKDKFEKIIFNLLSNAFKFSQAGKTIEVEITDTDQQLIIGIRDEGIGISKDRLRLLFERFESFANATLTTQSGTGIGLSLTRELLELHKASISVESEPGQGSRFTLSFRKGREHFDADQEFMLSDLQTSESAVKEATDQINDLRDEINATERISLLVVEDNDELRSFLVSTLSSRYDVLVAENGRIALRMAQEQLPDMIISDISMPEMDGIELAQRLKKDNNTSHIPFILLTAKVDMDTRLEAMNLCVDDYITKPFSLTYLEARIENLLKIREQLQQYYQSALSGTGVIALVKPDMTSVDDAFMQKALSYIETHYSQPDMSIDDMAAYAGVSRSSFFKKIKSLTGLAPADFVREFRIQKAAQLLQAGETNISQITFAVGLNDTKHFSRCFKQRFGYNPSEYRQHNEGNSGTSLC
jgi:signal transduction histidine kinase/CheY-like chemotaxis protein/ligand-binding sensor domain-containing protein/AraC-like DNA-binding protein